MLLTSIPKQNVSVNYAAPGKGEHAKHFRTHKIVAGVGYTLAGLSWNLTPGGGSSTVGLGIYAQHEDPSF